ncbi:MAG: tetratricopeptide repeat protein [Oligoflexia bacterium]|nr:tetratricopeptide repeat protein [Oligoflexia bacterium]
MSSPYSSAGTTLDRKSLKRPDELLKILNQFFGGLTQNYRLFLAVVLGVVAISGLGVFATTWREAQSKEGNNAFFVAQKALDEALGAYAAKTKPVEVKTDAKAPETKLPVSAETVRFQKFDVDATLGSPITQLKAVADRYDGSRAGFEASLALGNLYYEHGESAKAVVWLEKAAKEKLSPFDQATVLMALGHAYEDSGKAPEALKTYEKALATGDTVVKGQALLSIARSHELLKDVAKARSTYDQIISQLPSTEHAKTAEARKALLE